MDKTVEMNANALVAHFGKPASQLTKADIVAFIREKGIRMVDFMYPAEDGRVKTLNFMLHNLAYLETILTYGERVDGSSLFPSFVEAESSDLYVLPRFSTAFVSPFSETPTLCLLCSFFDKDGRPFACSPELTLHRAAAAFTASTGMTYEAMGELEYYVIAEDDGMFPAVDQRGYHESGPFAKLGEFRKKCMDYIAQTGGQIKYGHSEVGNFTEDGKVYEQNEIEFLPCPVESAADQLVLAKWVIRNLAYEYGLDVTFAPKITAGKAGSGLHIHMRLMKDGHNCMTSGGKLSAEARRAIAGMMELAPSITAFGNKTPVSYFRLVPHQEAPTSVCWGDCNRSVLVRVPLGWNFKSEKVKVKSEKSDSVESADWGRADELCGHVLPSDSSKQTVEMRSPDASADVYQLMAGLCVACRYGLEMDEGKALGIAADKYVGLGESGSNNDKFEQLPDCCAASAGWLERHRGVYEAGGVFSPRMLDGIISKLRGFDDAGLRAKAEQDDKLMDELVRASFHC